ncbi:phage tail assembly chaperone [Dyella marensis]|uniref:Phage tail assembly chaperone n=1 Tax=Dyella marensis TaxID=500610 RepID=A0A1I1ZXU0_9GAMM|nr:MULTISPECIES: phage tail assembly chaperone [Dyella]SFE36429.1 Phage tail assembly chaperone [Dyella marensis]
MFKIEPNPTFPATITVVGQGREQTLEVVYKHHTLEEYEALLNDIHEGRKTAIEAALELTESWNADMELSAETLDRLQKVQPGCVGLIIGAFGQELMVARKGN